MVDNKAVVFFRNFVGLILGTIFLPIFTVWAWMRMVVVLFIVDGSEFIVFPWKWDWSWWDK